MRAAGPFAAIVLMLLAAACGGSGPGLLDVTVPNPAMEPTIKAGSRLAVRASHVAPRLYEVIAFHPPTLAVPTQLGCADSNQGPGQRQPCAKQAPRESQMVYVRRVVGLPGDRIAIVDGHVIRNGLRERDPYAAPCGGVPECNLPQPIVIPPGDYYLLGDNRGASDDSRFWGPVPLAWIIGPVVR